MDGGSCVLYNPPSPHLKGRKGEIVRYKHWSLEQIVRWWSAAYPKMTLKKSIDIFADSVEGYKNCDYSKKLYYVADSFILATNISRIEFLTGCQAMEVANNLATDFGASKNQVQAQVDKIMKELEGKYDEQKLNF